MAQASRANTSLRKVANLSSILPRRWLLIYGPHHAAGRFRHDAPIERRPIHLRPPDHGQLRKAPPKPLHPPEPHDPVDVAAMLRDRVRPCSRCTSRRCWSRRGCRRSGAVHRRAGAGVLPTVLIAGRSPVGWSVGQPVGEHQPAARPWPGAWMRSPAGGGRGDQSGSPPSTRSAGPAPPPKPRFRAGHHHGYALATLGFGMLVHPTWAALPGYLVLVWWWERSCRSGRPFPALNPVLPTVGDGGHHSWRLRFVADTAQDGLLRVITRPWWLLPGISLSPSGDGAGQSAVISGPAGWWHGRPRAVGAAWCSGGAGACTAHRLHPQSPPPVMGAWSVYVATVVVGVGPTSTCRHRRRRCCGGRAAIGVAVIAQALAATVMPASHTGFCRAVLEVPFAMWAARIRPAARDRDDAGRVLGAGVPGALSFGIGGQRRSPAGPAVSRRWPSPVRYCRSRSNPGGLEHLPDHRHWFTRPRGAPCRSSCELSSSTNSGRLLRQHQKPAQLGGRDVGHGNCRDW